MKIMSNSPANMEDVCRKSGKLPEKSNFSQTCSLLSQYLKEKRSFGNLNLEMIRKLEAEASKGKSEMFKRPQEAAATTTTTTTTMDLLPNIEKSAAAAGGGEIWIQNAAGTESSSPIVKSSDLLPNFAGFGSSDSVEDAIRKADFSKSTTTDPETAQMTIFYGGQVLVFDDFPSDKAKLVMLLASSLNSTNSSGCDRIINSGCPVASSSKAVSTPTTDPPMHQPQTKGSVIPIARRTSLHRFLSKRKDRVVSKAPYQVNNRSSPPPKPEENMNSLMCIDLEAQTSNQLELKL